MLVSFVILCFLAYIYWIAAAAVIICAVAVIASKLMVSVEDLCAEGKYIEAYKKAKAEEKMDVLSENVIAVLSQESSDLLKDPSSLVLRNAWYYPYLRNDGEIGGRVVI